MITISQNYLTLGLIYQKFDEDKISVQLALGLLYMTIWQTVITVLERLVWAMITASEGLFATKITVYGQAQSKLLS